MIKKIGNLIILQPEEDSKCEICGKVDELRPYGPNGENVCFECGMKDEPTTRSKAWAAIRKALHDKLAERRKHF